MSPIIHSTQHQRFQEKQCLHQHADVIQETEGKSRKVKTFPASLKQALMVLLRQTFNGNLVMLVLSNAARGSHIIYLMEIFHMELELLNVPQHYKMDFSDKNGFVKILKGEWDNKCDHP
ncbi:hypothetical protein Bhyg_06691 [Pseudolycoriella hygida]|uniref:Uncharacterized protein n=1 Tax=Pseudolycoriella hygida TaxID=35572 RepID=A0A9Q0N2S7_9DIPT|nr:hypothetical protein Bhyg_06691 [Pseudolycoriella hygida]